MNRIFASVLAVMFLVACKTTEEPGSGGTGGGTATGGATGSGGVGAGGAGTGGSTGSGGGSGGSGAGGAGSGGSGSGGTGAGGSGTGGAAADAPVDAPADSKTDGPASDRPGILGEGADYPGRPEVRICNKEWTQEQCCEFLCRCLVEICSDAPKAKNGIGTCKTWCPKLSNMAMRCHVYHCFESVSMGGKKDHDSHCGHAADQVPGGMCRKDVYN